MKLSLSIIVGLLAVIAFMFWRLNRVSADLDRTAAVLQEKTAEITYLKAKSGKIIASKPAATISQADLEKHYADLAKVLQADFRVKLNKLQAVLQAKIEATGSGQVRIVRDTVRLIGGAVMQRDSLFVQDGYLDLAADISFQENAGYKYTYSDSILFALARKRKGWFGKESLYGEVRMSNPNSRSTGQTSILIRERQKRFNVSVGAGYDPFTNQVRPGFFVGYSLLRF